jgi:hypothetical protein
MAQKPSPAVSADLAESKNKWHRAQAHLPIQEKFRILLKLQAEDLPLIRQRRAMQPWERPWAIEP